MDRRYEVISLLGAGTQGTTYEALDIVTNTKVVLKQISLQKCDEQQKQQLMLECQLNSTLNHPFIIKQINYFQKDQSIFQVQELAEYGDLEHQLSNQKDQIPEKNILTIIYQVLLALDYLHSNNIIHRDLKPANIVIHPDKNFKTGRFALCDFGVSKQTNQAQTFVGTPYFMAPEIVAEQKYTFNVDIWALGVLTYKCATGNYPYNGATSAQLFKQIQEGSYIPLPEFFTENFKNLVKQMLEKDPNSRPSAEFLLKLDIFQSRHQFCVKNQICDVSKYGNYPKFEPKNVEVQPVKKPIKMEIDLENDEVEKGIYTKSVMSQIQNMKGLVSSKIGTVKAEEIFEFMKRVEIQNFEEEMGKICTDQKVIQQCKKIGFLMIQYSSQ